MTWHPHRYLFRRNRRIDMEPHLVALLCVVIGGSLILYFVG